MPGMASDHMETWNWFDPLCYPDDFGMRILGFTTVPKVSDGIHFLVYQHARLVSL